MKQQPFSGDMCVLVVSCDKYEDCWEPFSLCMEKFWPDCPYPVYLATETKDIPPHSIYEKAIHSTNPSWTGLLREVCQQIDDKYILITLDDHWMNCKVSSAEIAHTLDLLKQTPSIGVCYLDYMPKKKVAWKDSSYYELIPGFPYRLSAGPAIWSKDFLLTACSEDVDAWNFERLKSFDPITYQRTVLTCSHCLYPRIDLSGAILRGKWQSFVPKFAKENNLPIDFSKRKIMTFRDNLKISIRSFIFNLNPALIVKVQNWLYNHQIS